MNSLLSSLRKTHKLEVKDVASKLKISTEDYNHIESGEFNLTSGQADILSDLYGIEARHLLADNSSVVNYNIGNYSRGITNVQNYYEASEDKEK